MTAWVALGLLLGLVVVAFVLYPLVVGGTGAGEVEPLAEGADRQALYRQVLEVEFDERVGKLSTEDAAAMKADLLRRAAALLRAEAREESELEAEIEREIAAVRRALAAVQKEPVTP